MPQIKTIMIISLMSMCWWRNNLIMMLLSLELLLLTVFFSYSNLSPSNLSHTLLMFLTMMVSASSFGLGILVLISRTHKSSMATPINNLIYQNYYSDHFTFLT